MDQERKPGPTTGPFRDRRRHPMPFDEFGPAQNVNLGVVGTRDSFYPADGAKVGVEQVCRLPAKYTEEPSALKPPTGQPLISAITTPPRRTATQINSSSSRFIEENTILSCQDHFVVATSCPRVLRREGGSTREPRVRHQFMGSPAASCAIGCGGSLTPLEVTATQAKADGGRFWM